MRGLRRFCGLPAGRRDRQQQTEVYLQLIRETLEAGKQALVLIPEINLGPQTLARFEQRFNARIALLHSAVNDRDRLDAWLAARDGKPTLS